MKNNTNAAAIAFSTAFVADIEAASALRNGLVSGRVDRNGLIRMVARDLEAMKRGSREPALFPNVRAVVREFVAQEHRQGPAMAGMGQWDVIGQVVGAAAGAAASIYSAVQNTAMQKDLLKLQQQKTQAEISIAQMQAQAAQTQLAQANAAAGQASASEFTLAPGPFGPSVAGIPIIPAAVAAVSLAVGGYFMMKK